MPALFLENLTFSHKLRCARLRVFKAIPELFDSLKIKDIITMNVMETQTATVKKIESKGIFTLYKRR